jgi:hypothetical protein
MTLERFSTGSVEMAVDTYTDTMVTDTSPDSDKPSWFGRLLALLDSGPLIAVSPVFPGMPAGLPAQWVEDAVKERRAK